MKKQKNNENIQLRSRFLLIFSLSLSLLIFGVLIMQIVSGEIDFSLILSGIAIAIIFPFLVLSNKLQYDDESLEIFTLRRKSKINYGAIISIKTSSFIMYIGGYWIETYGNRKFFVYLPFEYRRLRKFFDTIGKTASGVEFDVWWYKKTKVELFKIIGKKLLFVSAIVCACFFYIFFVKK